MKTIYYIMLICSLLSLTVDAKDESFVPSSSYIVFEASDNAPTATVSLENRGDSDIDVGELTIKGAHSDEFGIVNDGCGLETLEANASCMVEVKFAPKNNGIKNALLEIPYSNGNLYVFLTNYEDNKQNVQKRLAPVMYDINISEKLNANTSYIFRWSLIGYHDSYKVSVVMFDCTDVPEGECGADYNDNFLDSTLLSPVSTESADWIYQDQQATRFNYTYTTTLPAKRADGSDWSSSGTDIVIRFYVISQEDEDNGKTSLSLMIPGNLSDRYYDASGRKIEKTMCPEDGCSDE